MAGGLTAGGLRGKTQVFLFAALVLNIALWQASSGLFAKWAGVPPVPTRQGAVMMALGDEEFSYRTGALTLQNLGDGGGLVTPIRDYDFEKLGRWFWLLNDLDPASDHVPMAAAYYFGGTRVPKDVAVVVKYLSVIGDSPVGEKWRWLAHAAYLARHRMKDLDLALELAYRLSRIQPLNRELPMWARQMPAFVLKEQGDKAASKELMEQMLLSEKDAPPQEINFMKAYLTEQLGVPPEEVEQLMKLRGQE
jgi:hypothetical protein